MTITLNLNEEQSWVLVSALGRAWADAMKAGDLPQVAESILKLQELVRERQDAAYELMHNPRH